MTASTRSRTQTARATLEQARRRRGRRLFWAQLVGAGVVVVLVVAVVVTLIRSSGEDQPAAAPGSATGSVASPSGLADDGSVPVGDPAAPVTVALYYDYLCPACAEFERVNGDELTRLIEDGVVRVELRPMAFLDPLSAGTAYSTRAANAFATVVDRAPDRIWEFHAALYAAQPAEGGPGLSDEAIASLAIEAGVPDVVATAFGEGTYESWVVAMTQRARDAGVEGTPTIVVDGTLFTGDPFSLGPLTTAIERAAGDR